MYLIDPIPVTPANGVLVSSNVAYPDTGMNPLNIDEPIDWPRWVRGRGYVYDAGVPFYVTHLGALYKLMVTVPATPANSTMLQLPPGHTDNDWPPGAWLRVFPPATWGAGTDYEDGALVAFPEAIYPPYASTDPLLSAEERFTLASTPNFGDYAEYPSGTFRRNAVADDQESLLPLVPSLASKYWEAMEPPLFEQYPELRIGELTTYRGRVWRKRTATMARYEAPPSAPDDWALVRTCNRYAMFDSSAQSQTRQRAGSWVTPPDPELNEPIVTVLQAPAGRIVDAVCLLNLEATSVRVQVVASTAVPPVTTYDQTRSMVTTAMVISNWYDYFTAPRHYQSSVLFDDIPGTAGATVTITITHSGGQAACGRCIVGKRVELGATLLGLGTGFKDYSVKARDGFGNMTVKEGDYSKRLVLPVRVHNDLLEPLERTLIGFRATAAMYIGHREFPTSWAYGWFTDLNVTVPYPTFATYELEIESTT